MQTEGAPMVTPGCERSGSVGFAGLFLNRKPATVRASMRVCVCDGAPADTLVFPCCASALTVVGDLCSHCTCALAERRLHGMPSLIAALVWPRRPHFIACRACVSRSAQSSHLSATIASPMPPSTLPS